MMPHTVDKHVGYKLKKARRLHKLSLKETASRLGVSFQQLQKYETGENRVSASRLFELGQVLGVSIGYFFEDLPAYGDSEPQNGSLPEIARQAKTFQDENLDPAQSHPEIQEPGKNEKEPTAA